MGWHVCGQGAPDARMGSAPRALVKRHVRFPVPRRFVQSLREDARPIQARLGVRHAGEYIRHQRCLLQQHLADSCAAPERIHVRLQRKRTPLRPRHLPEPAGGEQVRAPVRHHRRGEVRRERHERVGAGSLRARGSHGHDRAAHHAESLGDFRSHRQSRVDRRRGRRVHGRRHRGPRRRRRLQPGGQHAPDQADVPPRLHRTNLSHPGDPHVCRREAHVQAQRLLRQPREDIRGRDLMAHPNTRDPGGMPPPS
mmetsp:Transcript_74/g.275  ORF Transcript_74/g.275 Transcript_74/m.275 type:complete len:253 (-) Transcript_74:221-979(-)